MGLVGINGSYYFDSYNNPIVLINNTNSTDPTYSQLLDFLQHEYTDTYYYNLAYANQSPGSYYGSAQSKVDIKGVQAAINNLVPYPSVPRICSDFAERLHNSSEMAGFRCGYVIIELQGTASGHALNVFNTTDKGLIYIDDTGATTTRPTNRDKTVNIQIGKPYSPESLFPGEGFFWQSLGIVASVNIVWDGNWN
ncbi:MAG: hypothetical protein C4542_00090 [Dehalococcoidia bacterium]|nr:MAG: hypothetical protein C4542_00090 [Dehalococcoidia bacterium]